MVCAKCGKEIDSYNFMPIRGEDFCLDCYRALSRRKWENRAPEKKAKSEAAEAEHSMLPAVLYGTAALLFVLGFIAGIVLGNVYAVPMPGGAGLSARSFNGALMAACWAGAFLSGLLLVSLGKIIDLLEIIEKK